jgi:translation initiation factor IF-3
MNLAIEKKLDLVKIAPNANPPVCKIMDYGKFRYEQQKRDKEARKKQKITSLKEVRLSLTIEDHDLTTKAKNAIKFLSEGDKVKVTLKFKGRELGHPELGKEVIGRFAMMIDTNGVMEKEAKLEGKSMTVIFAPRN